MTPSLARSLLLCAWAVCACSPPSEGLRNVSATVAAMRGHYHVEVEVNGWAGVATSVWIHLVPDTDLVAASQQCPRWDQQTVSLGDSPMEAVRTGGEYVVVGLCVPAIFYLPIHSDDWAALDELTVRVADASGESRFVFENFVRTPVVVVEEPASGIVRRGESFVLRFDPSVDILPAFTMDANVVPQELGVRWANVWMKDVAIDHFRARFTVPEDAALGPTALRFDSGNFPPTFGFNVGVRSCEDAITCGGRRVSGGGLAVPSDELDDDTVEVHLTVQE